MNDELASQESAKQKIFNRDFGGAQPSFSSKILNEGVGFVNTDTGFAGYLRPLGLRSFQATAVTHARRAITILDLAEQSGSHIEGKQLRKSAVLALRSAISVLTSKPKDSK